MNPQTQRVELTWVVTTPDGKETGRVSQVHDIPTGSLDSYWGDVAAAAGSQAALGIKEVIDNAIGKRVPKSASAPPSQSDHDIGQNVMSRRVDILYAAWTPRLRVDRSRPADPHAPESAQ